LTDTLEQLKIVTTSEGADIDIELEAKYRAFIQEEMAALFAPVLKELREYTDRAIEAEKRACLLEESDSRAKKEYFEANTKLKQLQVQFEEKEKKLRDFEEQKKRLNLMEVQLKIQQLEKSKKGFWWFRK